MKRNLAGRFESNPDSNIERVFQLVANGETNRERMAQLLNLTPDQVRYALVNLTNRKRITVATHGTSKGKGNGKGRTDNTYKPYEDTPKIARRPKHTLSGVSFIFNVGA